MCCHGAADCQARQLLVSSAFVAVFEHSKGSLGRGREGERGEREGMKEKGGEMMGVRVSTERNIHKSCGDLLFYLMVLCTCRRH